VIESLFLMPSGR